MPMTTPAECWATLRQLLAALAGQYRDDFRSAVIAADMGREPVGVLLHAGDIDPRPMTAADLLRCVPYYSELSFTGPMEKLAQGGWLVLAGRDTYRLTAKGRAATDSIYAAARGRLASLSPLAPADMERLAELLRALMEACRASASVPDQACVAASGNAGPYGEASPLAYAARAIETLTNFRCDAHRLAWRPCGVDGPTWETLSWLREGRADSAASLHEWAQKQPHRRDFSPEVYARRLDVLIERGWVTAGADGHDTVAEAGRRQWQEVEDKTDSLFYEPWAALSADEVVELDARAKAVLAGLMS